MGAVSGGSAGRAAADGAYVLHELGDLILLVNGPGQCGFDTAEGIFLISLQGYSGSERA